jgi:hypothetical protein
MDVSTLMIRKDLVRRLDRIARRAGLSTTALANLLLEAAVHDEERWLARDQRVIKELEAILVRAILNVGISLPKVNDASGRARPPPRPRAGGPDARAAVYRAPTSVHISNCGFCQAQFLSREFQVAWLMCQSEPCTKMLCG